jgi:hypothetical protein
LHHCTAISQQFRSDSVAIAQQFRTDFALISRRFLSFPEAIPREFPRNSDSAAVLQRSATAAAMSRQFRIDTAAIAQ